MFTIIDAQDRKALREGRNYGIGFAFCTRSGNLLTTVQPLSPCKDYLNDVVYSEATGKPFQAYGLSTKKNGCFDDGHAYLLMGILPYSYGGKHSQHAAWSSALGSILPVASFLSHFERGVGVPVSEWHKIEDSRVLAILPKFWVEATYRISLWSLLARVGLKYPGEGDPMAFLKACNDEDHYMVNAAIPKLEKMMAGTIPEQDLTKETNVHNMGIVSYKFQ